MTSITKLPPISQHLSYLTSIIGELHNASRILKEALDQYRNACFAITSHYELGSTFNGFSDIIAIELQNTASYETAINESTKFLRKVRNRCLDIVPISSLPPEILSRIFLLAHKMEPRFLKGTGLEKYPSRSPESLLHVCSYWHSVALALPNLWTHIDIAPYHELNGNLFTYGKLFAANARQKLLDIHIDMSGGFSWSSLGGGLLEFCAFIAARSLDTLWDGKISILENPFANCVPWKLTRLVITSSDSKDMSPEGFIVASDSESPPTDYVWDLAIPHHHLEKTLRYISVLRLDVLYPYWTSQAYHGLVKLRLTDVSGSFITISQLAGILSASPQLRYVYFGSSITLDDVVHASVRLDDLDVFHLDIEDPLKRDSVLRIISPGSNPLRMSIILGDAESPPLTNSEWIRFFSRSNIAQLRVDSPDGAASLPLPELLASVPKIQALSLDGFDLRPACKGSSDSVSMSYVGSRLNTLHLAYSVINPEVFRWVTETYPIQRITIDEGTCFIEFGGNPDDVHYVRDWKCKLLEVSGAIDFIRDTDPIKGENWD